MQLAFWYVLMHCGVECEEGLDAESALLLLCLQRLAVSNDNTDCRDKFLHVATAGVKRWTLELMGM